jgi:hypothetical protein
MAIRIEAEPNGLLVIRVSSLVTREDMKQWQEAIVAVIKRYDKAKALVILEVFQGWEKTDAWEDISFIAEYDKKMEKIAVIGDLKWRDDVFAFMGKPFRSASIEFFKPSQESEARTWLK